MEVRITLSFSDGTPGAPKGDPGTIFGGFLTILGGILRHVSRIFGQMFLRFALVV